MAVKVISELLSVGAVIVGEAKMDLGSFLWTGSGSCTIQSTRRRAGT